MLTNKQKALVKQAQRDAGLSDLEYRECWGVVSGQLSVVSSTDPRLTDEHFDTYMSYVEAIFWRKRDHQQSTPKPSTVFSVRGYWAAKNTRQENSRDRYAQRTVGDDIADLERQLGALGFNEYYCRAIRDKVVSRPGALAVLESYRYRRALQRTLDSKLKKAPF